MFIEQSVLCQKPIGSAGHQPATNKRFPTLAQACQKQMLKLKLTTQCVSAFTARGRRR